MKLVSVIVPTFNSVKFTSKLCNSLLSQTHRKMEVIIVDNFSSDNTIDEIKKKIMIKDLNIIKLIIME